VQIRSRNGKDFDLQLPLNRESCCQDASAPASIDAEIVALDKAGRPFFQELQHPSRARLIVFFAFDVLQLDDRDLRRRPLQERRESCLALSATRAYAYSDAARQTAFFAWDDTSGQMKIRRNRRSIPRGIYNSRSAN